MAPTSNAKYFFKQSLNVPALLELGNLFVNPSIAIPKMRVNSVQDLDIAMLKKMGIRCIAFDKDNTISTTYVDDLHPSLKQKMREIKEAFPQTVAILSNSVGTLDDENYKGAIETERNMDIPVIRHANKKPGCLDEVLQHFRTATKSEVEPKHICMVALILILTLTLS